MTSLLETKVLEKAIELPAMKSLRCNIIIEIMKHLEIKDLLKSGLVSKEWLSLSRSNQIWSIHIQKDLKEMGLKKHFSLLKRERKEYIQKYFSQSENVSNFVEYYECIVGLPKDEILSMIPKIPYRRPGKPRMCD